ncbi:MAG: hypothetical protein V7K33_07445 [Nostoc sp.]
MNPVQRLVNEVQRWMNPVQRLVDKVLILFWEVIKKRSPHLLKVLPAPNPQCKFYNVC